jgi:glycosyltransferase involved in cell wall biosynthesis
LKISIIIPAFNEAKLLPDTIGRIRTACTAFSSAGWDHEIIVCDNNSTDGTGKIAEQAGAQVVFEPINQIGRARNRGAEAATGDWLVFIDADSFPSSELFADMIEAIESGTCIAGGSTVKMGGGRKAVQFVAGLWNLISRTNRLLAGSFIFCQACVFRDLGGFNLELYASEEIELSRRLKKAARKAGKRIVILTRHPLVTSERKTQLYSDWEHLRFLLRTVFGLGRTLKSAEACHIWYDGRR